MVSKITHKGQSIEFEPGEDNPSLKINDQPVKLKVWKLGDKLMYQPSEMIYQSFEDMERMAKVLVEDWIAMGKIKVDDE